MDCCLFTRTFCAAHRVWNDPGKCHNIHGHNYLCRVEVRCNEEALTPENFTVPFDLIKGCIDGYDHTLIVDRDDPLLLQLGTLKVALSVVPGVPSTEYLARLIAVDILDSALKQAPNPDAWFSVTVFLRETDGIEASYQAVSSS